jgi:hypothetical protein
MKRQLHKTMSSAWIVTALCSGLACLSCGPKDSVEEEDTASKDAGADTRSRLTGGSSTMPNMNYCRYPLDLGTTLDPRRPGLVQTVLTSAIDARCAQSRDARITIRARQKLTLVGRYICRTGVQSGEQICTVPVSEILSPQRSTLSIAVTVDDTLRSSDLEASVELY